MRGENFSATFYLINKQENAANYKFKQTVYERLNAVYIIPAQI
jgi:hypothetical protein